MNFCIQKVRETYQKSEDILNNICENDFLESKNVIACVFECLFGVGQPRRRSSAALRFVRMPSSEVPTTSAQNQNECKTMNSTSTVPNQNGKKGGCRCRRGVPSLSTRGLDRSTGEAYNTTTAL